MRRLLGTVNKTLRDVADAKGIKVRSYVGQRMDTNLASSLPGRSASIRAFTPVFDGLWTRVNALLPAHHSPQGSALGLGSAGCVAPLEQASRHETPRAAAAQRVSPERGGIARQHDERDEDVLGETAGAFTQA